MLGNAFQAAALSRPTSPTRTVSAKLGHQQSVLPKQQCPESIHPLASQVTQSAQHLNNNSDRCKAPTSSSIFLSRLFGSKSRPENDFSSSKENAISGKRRRRPMSAVFSQALHRLSSASIYNRRVRTVLKFYKLIQTSQFVCSSRIS